MAPDPRVAVGAASDGPTAEHVEQDGAEESHARAHVYMHAVEAAAGPLTETRVSNRNRDDSAPH